MIEGPKAELKGTELFYRFISTSFYILYKVCFRFKTYGTKGVPTEKDRRGVILASNHASYLDPPVLGISLKRRVTFLAKEYLFRHPLVGAVLRNIGAFPVKSDSGNDFKSIRELVRYLKAGHCVALFPEGTRSEDGALKAPEAGIGFLAMKSGAWVVPTYIEGSYAAMPKGAKSFHCKPIRVFYGEPFIPAENRAFEAMGDYLAVGEEIMKRIRALKEKAEQV